MEEEYIKALLTFQNACNELCDLLQACRLDDELLTNENPKEPQGKDVTPRDVDVIQKKVENVLTSRKQESTTEAKP